MNKYLTLVVVLITAGLMAACGAAPSQDSAGPKIMVMKPWSRPSPMVAGNGAVYMTLMNEGDSDDTLLSAETDVAEAVELHETQMVDDVMKMSPVANVEVPAGGSANLEPGGLHVMLINLKEELRPGEKLSLTLNFEKSGPMTIEAEIHEMGEAMEQEMEHEMEEDEGN